MKKIILMIFLTTILIISGCSSQSGSSFSSNQKTGTQSKDITGSGLEVDFTINTDDILAKKISYNLNIKNSGEKTIKLNKDNIKLITIEKLNDGSNIFTQKSLENFYSNIFSSNELSLVQNQEITGISGILEINDKYFKNINNDKFSYILNLNYNYQTTFSNNVQLDLSKSLNNRLNLLDQLSQAAPVKLENINLLNGPTNSEYILEFKIVDDNSFSFSKETIVKFSNLEFKFKNQILNNCKYYIKTNKYNKEINFENFILNKENKEVILKCLVDLSKNKNSGPINTIVSGNLFYNYDSKIINEIKLPDKRIENTNW